MSALYDPFHTHPSIDRRIGRLAAAQHGVFTRRQAISCGATKGAIAWRLRVGRWERIHPRVFRLAGTPMTWRQLALAACFHFGEGACVSHRSALALRAIESFDSRRIDVTVRRSRNRRLAGPLAVTIHSCPGGVPEDDVTTIEGIPVTKPARTLFDLAGIATEPIVERFLDEMLRRRLVSLPFLEGWLREQPRRRGQGASMLQRLVDARATIGVTESALETRILKLLREAGLPLPMLQFVVHDGDRFVGRLDFAYPERRVAIEGDGFAYHHGRWAFDDDRARGNALEALGWRVLRVTSRHLDERSAEVAAWVRRALGYP